MTGPPTASPSAGYAGLRSILKQVSTFGAVSVITTLLDFSLFNVLIWGEVVPVIAANTISYSAGIAASYLLNKRFTFGGGGRDRRTDEVALFVLFNIGGLALNNLAVALVARTGSAVLLNAMKLLAGAVAAVLKFIAFKRWVYPVPSAVGEDRAPSPDGR